MPKETFLNLNDEKKNRIIDSALMEFSERKFSESKVSNIVKSAGIARGSFYQYFEDLYDLYRYLMELAGHKKLESIGKEIEKIGSIPTKDVLLSIYETGLKFASENREYAKLGLMFLKEDEKFKNKIFDGFSNDSDKLFRIVLEKGVLYGDVDDKLDLDVASHMFTTMHIEMMQFFMKQIDINEENLSEIVYRYEKVLEILLYGIRRK